MASRELHCSLWIQPTHQLRQLTVLTLLLRSTDTRLPGPNEPIDFDTPPLNTLGFSPTGEPALYYHLDVQSTTPAPV
ncbi:MAG: hypothetical protein WA453_01755 [Methyloceanibacter sp.]